jgi:hypothetical protein
MTAITIVKNFSKAKLGLLSVAARYCLQEGESEVFVKEIYQQLKHDAPQSTTEAIGPELSNQVIQYIENEN